MAHHPWRTDGYVLLPCWSCRRLFVEKRFRRLSLRHNTARFFSANSCHCQFTLEKTVVRKRYTVRNVHSHAHMRILPVFAAFRQVFTEEKNLYITGNVNGYAPLPLAGLVFIQHEANDVHKHISTVNKQFGYLGEMLHFFEL